MTAARILEGLREAIAVVRGDAAPARSTTYIIGSTHNTSGNVTDFFPSPRVVATLPAKVGGVGASDGQVVSHTPSIGVETKHDDGLTRQKESADRSPTDA